MKDFFVTVVDIFFRLSVFSLGSLVALAKHAGDLTRPSLHVLLFDAAEALKEGSLELRQVQAAGARHEVGAAP